MKATPALADMAMVRQGRLSVSPVTDAEWAVILEMAGG
jgi:predicted RNA-binding protein with PUA-like domain